MREQDVVARHICGHYLATLSASLLTGLVVNDPERVRVQMAAELSDNDVREPPDHVQVFLAVFVVEGRCLVGISFVGTRTHVAYQVHLKVTKRKM